MDRSAVPGVRAVEHTADLALEIEAPSLPELFDRAARATVALIEADEGGEEAPEAPHPPSVERHRVALTAPALPDLLVRWLREILYLHQVRHLAYRGGTVELGDEGTLRAEMDMVPGTGSAVRELKGVTYHDLEVARSADRWRARIVYDV